VGLVVHPVCETRVVCGATKHVADQRTGFVAAQCEKLQGPGQLAEGREPCGGLAPQCWRDAGYEQERARSGHVGKRCHERGREAVRMVYVVDHEQDRRLAGGSAHQRRHGPLDLCPQILRAFRPSLAEKALQDLPLALGEPLFRLRHAAYNLTVEL